ncbi:MAG: AhpC/TSA family protein [Rhodospirillales bacterium]|nr:AhpC/TSA family protein [Rhodospirillales bacterium]
MSSLTPLIPRQPVPDLAVPTVGGEPWRLADQKPEHFTLVTFYRGLHCPICATYVRDLDSKFEEFARRGVSAIAISSDDAERSAQAKQKWRIEHLPLGYGLDLDTARRWGLYISAGHGTTSAGVAEPALFSEPGLFVVRPDGRLYFGTVQTMPFARPHFADILGALDFVIAKNYPARGEVTDPVQPTAAA